MGIRSRKATGAAVAVALAAGISMAACGSEENSPPPKTVPSLPAATANGLAVQSEQIAERLDSGDLCGAAHSADELDEAVAEARVPAEIRAELEVATEQLVNSVNCPPPPKPKKLKKEDGEKEDGGDHGDSEGDGSGPPGQDGDLPPGHQEDYEDAELNQP